MIMDEVIKPRTINSERVISNWINMRRKVQKYKNKKGNGRKIKPW